MRRTAFKSGGAGFRRRAAPASHAAHELAREQRLEARAARAMVEVWPRAATVALIDQHQVVSAPKTVAQRNTRLRALAKGQQGTGELHERQRHGRLLPQQSVHPRKGGAQEGRRPLQHLGLYRVPFLAGPGACAGRAQGSRVHGSAPAPGPGMACAGLRSNHRYPRPRRCAVGAGPAQRHADSGFLKEDHLGNQGREDEPRRHAKTRRWPRLSCMDWMAGQLERRQEEEGTRHNNPRPQGVIRPGSGTDVLLRFLRQSPGRWFFH